MCPQRTIPATRQQRHPHTHTPQTSLPITATRNRPSRPQQRTLMDFFRPATNTTIDPPPHPIQDQLLTPPTQLNPINLIHTPPATPVAHDPVLPTQLSQQPLLTTISHQQQLHSDNRNEPWGDIWALPLTEKMFRIVSKNTGTLNPQNLDMQAITNELVNINASVFAAQETNVHWDPLTTYQTYNQCKGATAQIKLTTATSQEMSTDWYKPGGTLLLTLDPWTSRIISHGSDNTLGRWAYQEFLGRNDKRIIIISGYRVCNQKFDAASMTVSAQQTRLLQVKGIHKPKPRKQFITDLITQIQHWRQAHKEVILCIDANESVDDPRSDIARLFTETDLTDLHHYLHPALQKPATHQRGSQAIDLMAGSPLIVSALLHAWIHPFGDPVCIKGDHHLLGIDLDPEILFGNADLPSYHGQTRGTNSRHPQKVTKFCKRVVDRCNQQCLAERLAALQHLPHLDPHHLEELEDIDDRLTKILLQADRDCTPPNSSPWSPELNQAYLRHRLWTIELTAHRTKRDLSAATNLIRQRLTPSPLDVLEPTRSLSLNLRNAQKALRAAKKAAAELRKQHLEATLNEARTANKKKKSQALTNLIRAEQNRRCYSAFRHTTKPKSQGGLAYITIHDGDNPTQMILDKDDMNHTLLEYSRKHFATAQGTPFTVEPLTHLLQYDGLTMFGDRILQGRVDLEALPIDEATRALLANMRDKTKNDDDRQHPLIYDELQKGIKKWPEKTTTSPSGRHLGIYKSLQKHVLSKEALEALSPSQSAAPLKQGRDVLFLIFDIMALTLRHTYTLNRWKTVWTLFIEKELGNPDLNRLRCIMLFEADWQLLLKWHSSYGFLAKSETANTLTPVQGGGRKGRSAIDQATQQVIETELIKLNQ